MRNLPALSSPSSTHLIDWFHLAMKLTVLQQQNKALLEENPEGCQQVVKTLERVKHYLWHGNADKALECLGVLLFDLDVHRRRFRPLQNWSVASPNLTPTFATTKSSFPTLANGIAKGIPSVPPLSNPPSTKWSVNDSSSGSRCNGHRKGPPYSNKPVPKC